MDESSSYFILAYSVNDSHVFREYWCVSWNSFSDQSIQKLKWRNRESLAAVAVAGIHQYILKRFQWYFQLAEVGLKSTIQPHLLLLPSRPVGESGGACLTGWPGRQGWAMEGSHNLGKNRCLSVWMVPALICSQEWSWPLTESQLWIIFSFTVRKKTAHGWVERIALCLRAPF